MEKMLHKLARQLDSLDEASLMALWSKYATLTSRFEPTRRWEDACLVFSLIQAKRWKNQLFNFSWSQQRHPPLKNRMDAASEIFNPDFDLEEEVLGEAKPAGKKPCRVLSFKPLAEAGESGTVEKDPDNDL